MSQNALEDAMPAQQSDDLIEELETGPEGDLRTTSTSHPQVRVTTTSSPTASATTTNPSGTGTKEHSRHASATPW